MNAAEPDSSDLDTVEGYTKSLHALPFARRVRIAKDIDVTELGDRLRKTGETFGKIQMLLAEIEMLQGMTIVELDGDPDETAGPWEGTPLHAVEPEPELSRFPLVNFYDLGYRVAGRGLIKGLIDRGTLVVTYGPSGSSKTFLALDMALRVASGTDWHGRKVDKHSVVYVAAEGGGSITNRIKAYRDFYLKEDRDVLFDLVPAPVNLLDQDGAVEALIKDVLKLEDRYGERTGFIVIDTLSQSMPGGEENTSKDMGTAVDSVNRIRRAIGCTVNLIHHSGKNEAAGARGHSSLRAATDTELEVSDVGGDFFQMRPTKQRDYPMGEPCSYRLEVVDTAEDEDGEMQTTCVVVPVNSSVVPDVKLRGRLNDRCRIFEGCMQGLMQSESQPLPTGVTATHTGQVSPGQFGISLENVRDLFYERIEDQDDERDTSRDSLRKVFSRTKEKLLALERIGVSGDWVWFGKRS